jgi:hypothetical protein
MVQYRRAGRQRQGSKGLLKKLIVFGAIFVAGLAAGLGLAWYASPVWSFNEAVRAQEALVNASVSQYREGRFAEAAVLMQQANKAGERTDEAWPFLFPYNGAVVRATGVLKYLHPGPDYRAPEAAYLFRLAGENDRARPYYESLATRHGRTTAQLDLSASSFLRESAWFEASAAASASAENLFRQSRADRMRSFRSRPLDEQLALFLYGSQEVQPPADYLADCFALNGPTGVALVRERLAVAGSDSDTRDMAALLEVIQSSGAYDVQHDSALIDHLRMRIAAMVDPGLKAAATARVGRIAAATVHTAGDPTTCDAQL